jgi:hypothetical protein
MEGMAWGKRRAVVRFLVSEAPPGRFECFVEPYVSHLASSHLYVAGAFG